MRAGDPPDVGLQHATQREYGFCERVRTDRVQEVALVLVRINAFEKCAVAIDHTRARVVARCEQVAAETVSMIAEHAELYLPVAEHIRIGRTSLAVLFQEILEHAVPVLAGKIHMVQGNAELLADSPRILQVLRRGAIAVVILPVGHMQRVDVGAGFLQANGSHGGVHTA